jgi:hypothetical protein
LPVNSVITLPQNFIMFDSWWYKYETTFRNLSKSQKNYSDVIKIL